MTIKESKKEKDELIHQHEPDQDYAENEKCFNQNLNQESTSLGGWFCALPFLSPCEDPEPPAALKVRFKFKPRPVSRFLFVLISGRFLSTSVPGYGFVIKVYSGAGAAPLCPGCSDQPSCSNGSIQDDQKQHESRAKPDCRSRRKGASHINNNRGRRLVVDLTLCSPEGS